MLLATEQHKILIKEIEAFQKELEKFLVNFHIGYTTAIKIHAIEDSQDEFRMTIEKLQETLNIIIDVEKVSVDGEENEYVWVKYDHPFFPMKTYYFRHSANNETYENFTDKTLAGVLNKYCTDITISTTVLDALSGTDEFSSYRKRLQKILDDFLVR